MNNVKLSKLWDSLQSSYWFIPSLFALASIVLAIFMLEVDRRGNSTDWWWIYTGGPDGARGLLSAVAGSMVSVTATAFSITIVALQLAASNFGPRLLGNFMKDTGNQVVLGTFIGTFIYCLLVLRTVRGDGDGYNEFVPQFSVTVGTLLAITSIAFLIYFIHHASTIIQASHIIAQVSGELDKAIDRLFPANIGQPSLFDRQHLAEIPNNFESQASSVKSNKNGYLQAIDEEELMKLTREFNLLVRLEIRPGKFVLKGSHILVAFPGDKVDAEMSRRINDLFILGRERAEYQDIEFPIDQLVEIALRALSPGINDPFTALRCIDRLSAALARLAQRDFPSPYRYDGDNNLRIIAETVKFEQLADRAFNQIRLYGKSDLAVTVTLLESIATIADYTDNPKYRGVLRRQADAIERASRDSFAEENDLQEIFSKYKKAIDALDRDKVDKFYSASDRD